MCASIARRPRLTKFCDALSSTSMFDRRSATTFPSVVRSGRSTSHRYFGLVVPLAVTISVELLRTLPLTAMFTSVTQCMPAPVSASHIAFAQVGAAPVGMNCRIACVSCAPLFRTKWLAKAASP
eukprot:6208757-Pleurochrysis_carterae.AAC.2